MRFGDLLFFYLFFSFSAGSLIPVLLKKQHLITSEKKGTFKSHICFVSCYSLYCCIVFSLSLAVLLSLPPLWVGFLFVCFVFFCPWVFIVCLYFVPCLILRWTVSLMRWVTLSIRLNIKLTSNSSLACTRKQNHPPVSLPPVIHPPAGHQKASKMLGGLRGTVMETLFTAGPDHPGNKQVQFFLH